MEAAKINEAKAAVSKIEARKEEAKHVKRRVCLNRLKLALPEKFTETVYINWYEDEGAPHNF